MKQVEIKAGSGGFGGPLFLNVEGKKNKIVSVSGGIILPVAYKLGELLECEVINGFSTSVPDDEIIAVVIDCGGTARCGVYPKKGIYTINVLPVGKSGPLAKYIVPEIYVSGVTENCLSMIENDEQQLVNTTPDPVLSTYKENAESSKEAHPQRKNVFLSISSGVSSVMSHFYTAGKDSVSTILHSVLPFMAFVSLLIGFINGTGVGTWISEKMIPLGGSLPGMFILALICAIPFLSPLLGPGAVIAQTVGVLIGNQIGQGALSPSFALPALFAINAQVGCDFIPVGLSMADATPETIEIGTPAVLFSRLITGPGAVLIAYVFSVGLFPNN